MVAMKKTLLEIVQDILNDLDSDSVNSIDDTIEATQVSKIVTQAYFDMISDRVVPEHKQLFRLTALSDSLTPTHFSLPDTVANIEWVEYNRSTDGDQEYNRITWEDPIAFIRRTAARDSSATTTTTVLDIDGGTELLIFNDRMPSFYTSFNNKHVVMDAHDNAIDTTLQSSKCRGYGELIPTVTLTDVFVFDIEAKYFPYLQAEAKSKAFSILHKTVNQKVEQQARRHKNFIQKERWRFSNQKPSDRRNYGRS